MISMPFGRPMTLMFSPHFMPAVFHCPHLFTAVMSLVRRVPVSGFRSVHAFVGLTALVRFMPFRSLFHSSIPRFGNLF
jgi:hypothetical protein